VFRAAEHSQKDWIPLSELLNRLPRPRFVKNDCGFSTVWFATNKRKSESHCRSPFTFFFQILTRRDFRPMLARFPRMALYPFVHRTCTSSHFFARWLCVTCRVACHERSIWLGRHAVETVSRSWFGRGGRRRTLLPGGMDWCRRLGILCGGSHLVPTVNESTSDSWDSDVTFA